MTKRILTGEERALWRRVTQTVRARRAAPEPEAAAPPGPDPAPRPAPAPAPPAPKPKPQPGALAERSQDRKVRRGKVEIAMRLDLHGHTQDQALAALHGFLRAAQGRGERVVLVITGKGRGVDTGVLRRRLPEWLATRAIRPLTAGFAEAHARHGGAGAFYVFVKRAYLEAFGYGLEAFSSRPETPRRRISSAATAPGATPADLRTASRW